MRMNRFSNQGSTLSGFMRGGSSVEFGSDFEPTDEKLKQYMEKRLAQNKINFELQVKNIKPIVFEEAVQFLIRESASIADMLTKSHHKIITNFMDFIDRNETMIKEREVIKQKWQYVERALALKSPVMEAEYALDDSSALSLYDCLIPKIKAYRKLQIRPEIIIGAEDFKA